jgi:hypothetical protein
VSDDFQYYRAGYDWSGDFPETQLVRSGVDGDILLAYEDEAYWVIIDESKLEPTLDPVDDYDEIQSLVAIGRYEDTRALVAALQDRGVAFSDLERVLRMKH